MLTNYTFNGRPCYLLQAPAPLWVPPGTHRVPRWVIIDRQCTPAAYKGGEGCIIADDEPGGIRWDWHGRDFETAEEAQAWLQEHATPNRPPASYKELCASSVEGWE